MWARIGAEFVRNRERSLHNAFKQMQLRIMENCAILSPHFFSPKDIIAISMDIESFMKDHPDKTSDNLSPLDMFSAFLRGDDITSTSDPEASDSSVRIV